MFNQAFIQRCVLKQEPTRSKYCASQFSNHDTALINYHPLLSLSLCDWDLLFAHFIHCSHKTWSNLNFVLETTHPAAHHRVHSAIVFHLNELFESVQADQCSDLYLIPGQFAIKNEPRVRRTCRTENYPNYVHHLWTGGRERKSTRPNWMNSHMSMGSWTQWSDGYYECNICIGEHVVAAHRIAEYLPKDRVGASSSLVYTHFTCLVILFKIFLVSEILLRYGAKEISIWLIF